MFEAGDGDIQFHDRHTRLKAPYLTSQAIFSDIPGFESLVLYLPLWHPNLDGASFLSRDQNHYLCTVTGAVWGVTGRTFDIIDDLISAGDVCKFEGVLSFTIFAWVKRGTTANTIIAKGSAADQYWLFCETNIVKFDRWIGGVLKSRTESTITLILDQWYLVCVVYDGTKASIYMSGALDKIGAADANSIGASTNPFRVGNRSDVTTSPWGGTIGDVLVYNRALTASEIQGIYQQTKWRYGL